MRKMILTVILFLIVKISFAQKNEKTDLGVWEISNTLLHAPLIKGSFSNSATYNSKAYLSILVYSTKKIHLYLYEYESMRPVTHYGTTKYHIYIPKAGFKNIIRGSITSGSTLVLNQSNSKKLHQILLQDGYTSFRISESEYGISTYDFTISNRNNQYQNAIEKLKKVFPEFN